MESIRYRPGEALRWLETGAANIRRGAQAKGKSIVVAPPMDAKGIGQGLVTAATALVDLGKGAYAELIHRQVEASEYVLQEDRFDVVTGSSIKSITYDRIRSILYHNDRATIELDKGSVAIKPYAYLVAGRVKVAVGWNRNGMDVPYELLIEEISARSSVEINDGDEN